jgi:hypothetical protein
VSASGRKLPLNLMLRESAPGTSETLERETWASAFEKLLLMGSAKSEFLDFLPK